MWTWILACIVLSLSPGHVMRVIDGDSFILYSIRVPPEERVRVLGVDCPERGQPGYTEAGEFTRLWLARGPFVLHSCKRDSFGRLLADVSRGTEKLADILIENRLCASA